MAQKKKAASQTGDETVDSLIHQLIEAADIHDGTQEYKEMLVSILKLAQQKPTRGDLLLFKHAFNEMRYAHKIFQPYADHHKITVFGSARTWSASPEYKAAEAFGKLMADAGFMIITGGGDGIMGAAQAGGGRERGFGLNIRLPFEQSANETIEGDKKLINFRYFFTRKLNFVKESHAIALFPGGFGTMDEGFETLTLIQTGKAQLIPMVFIDSPGGDYWQSFEAYLRGHLLADGLISPWDFNLFKITDNIEEARDEILRFYHNYHSYRFVNDTLVVRMKREIPDEVVDQLMLDFTDILLPDGRIWKSKALPQERNEPDILELPRLCLDFDRMTFGRLRLLFDRLNEY